MEVEPLPVDPNVAPRRRTNREPLPLWIKFLFGGSILVAIVLAFVLRGDLTHFHVFIGSFCVVIISSGVAAVLAGIVHRRRGRERPPGVRPKIVSACVAIAFATGIQLMGYAVGEGLYEHDHRAAQKYLMNLVMALDEVREETGRYPETLDGVVGPDPDPPRLLAGRLDEVYQADPDRAGFTFLLDDPDAGPLVSAMRWTAAERAWRVVK